MIVKQSRIRSVLRITKLSFFIFVYLLFNSGESYSVRVSDLYFSEELVAMALFVNPLQTVAE